MSAVLTFTIHCSSEVGVSLFLQTLLQVTSECGFKMETCPICCETIVDATEETEGQEALFCEDEVSTRTVMRS